METRGEGIEEEGCSVFVSGGAGFKGLAIDLLGLECVGIGMVRKHHEALMCNICRSY